MSTRHRIWAKKALRDLRQKLGAACHWCWRGSRQGVKLEFDCIVPEGDRHHRFETNRRATFYRRMFRNGNLQLLCEACHNAKTRVQLDAEAAYKNSL